MHLQFKTLHKPNIFIWVSGFFLHTCTHTVYVFFYFYFLHQSEPTGNVLIECCTQCLLHRPHLPLQIVKEAYVDHTQFDKKDVHFDASSKPDNPKWSMVSWHTRHRRCDSWCPGTTSLFLFFLFFAPRQVDVQYQRMMKRFIPLSELKKYHLQHVKRGGALKNMALFTRARLSVQPLTAGRYSWTGWSENAI